jgi:quercetin dioxygenase-like cupin family protein
MLGTVASRVFAGLVVAAAVSLTVTAQDSKPQAQRTIFGHYDQAGVAGKEIVTGTVTLAPGAEVAFHTHPGEEAGYVVKGTLTWKVRGQPDKVLKAGDAFFNPRGSVHSIVAGSDGATAFSAWVVDKGKPMVQPAP